MRRNWKDFAAVLFGSLAAIGCANLHAASSGQIGCAENEIVITDDSWDLTSRTWVAECHGRRFFCSAIGTGDKQTQVNCKEDAADSDAPARPSRRSSRGCEYDTQCKGDRVCVEHECVFP